MGKKGEEKDRIKEHGRKESKEEEKKNKKIKEKNGGSMLTVDVAVAATASNTEPPQKLVWSVIIAFTFSDRQGELLKWKNE